METESVKIFIKQKKNAYREIRAWLNLSVNDATSCWKMKALADFAGCLMNKASIRDGHFPQEKCIFDIHQQTLVDINQCWLILYI